MDTQYVVSTARYFVKGHEERFQIRVFRNNTVVDSVSDLHPYEITKKRNEICEELSTGGNEVYADPIPV